jgi:hypothetical protein
MGLVLESACRREEEFLQTRGYIWRIANNRFSKWLAAVIVCYLLISPSTASADGFGEMTYFVWIPLSVFEATSVTFAAGNMYYVIEEEKPSVVWRVGGYVCGATNLALGFFFLSQKGFSDDFYLGLAIGQFVMGATNIGLTLWSSEQPEKKEKKITVSPVIIPDVRGQPAVGVGLSLVDW